MEATRFWKKCPRLAERPGSVAYRNCITCLMHNLFLKMLSICFTFSSCIYKWIRRYRKRKGIIISLNLIITCWIFKKGWGSNPLLSSFPNPLLFLYSFPSIWGGCKLGYYPTDIIDNKDGAGMSSYKFRGAVRIKRIREMILISWRYKDLKKPYKLQHAFEANFSKNFTSKWVLNRSKANSGKCNLFFKCKECLLTTLRL